MHRGRAARPRPRPPGAQGHRGRRLESRSRGGCPGVERRAGAQPRRHWHAGVLPPLRLEGPTGVGGVPRHGPCRDAQAAASGWPPAPDPVRAVVAWIDGRLDLAFNDEIKSDLRQMSLEAQSQMFAAPEVIGAAYAEILTSAGRAAGTGRGARAASPTSIPPRMRCRFRACCGPASKGNGQAAIAIASTCARAVLQFCLRGLGVAPASIARVLNESTTHLAATRHDG